MARSGVFREDEIEAVANLIRAWTKEKLTWSDVCKCCEPILGRIPTRQGLSQHKAILTAFQARKDRLRVSPEEGTPMPSSLAIASRRIAMLNARIAELEKENDMLRDRFIVWQYNASMRMSQDELERPLPEVNRRVNKEEKR